MFADVRVDGAERVVEQVDVSVAVDGARQRHTLLLTARQVDALLTLTSHIHATSVTHTHTVP